MYVSCIKEMGNCIALTRRHSPLLAECEQHLGQFSGSLLKVKLPLAKCTLHLYNIYVAMIVKGFTKLSGLHETWPSSDKQMYRIFIPTQGAVWLYRQIKISIPKLIKDIQGFKLHL